MTKQHYVLQDGMDYSGEETSPNDISFPDSPGCAYQALADRAARLGWHEQPGSNKRLAWLEDSNGKIVAEATVSATTILDDDFQKAIEDEELAWRQEQAQTQQLATALQEARQKLQTDHDRVTAELKHIPYVHRLEINRSILDRSIPYRQAVSDFELYSDLEEDSFFFRKYYKFLADRAEKRMEDISRKIFESVEAKREFGEAYFNNRLHEAKSAEASKIAGYIAEIKYYESKLESGQFTGEKFREMLEQKSVHNKLNNWQQMVIHETNPKLDCDQIKQAFEKLPSLDEMHWMTPSTKLLYGIPLTASERDQEHEAKKTPFSAPA